MWDLLAQETFWPQLWLSLCPQGHYKALPFRKTLEIKEIQQGLHTLWTRNSHAILDYINLYRLLSQITISNKLIWTQHNFKMQKGTWFPIHCLVLMSKIGNTAHWSLKLTDVVPQTSCIIHKHTKDWRTLCCKQYLTFSSCDVKHYAFNGHVNWLPVL